MIRSFNGKTPRIHDSAFVSEAAYVVGDVEIGAGSSVWPGAVIRADYGLIKIGCNTHVEDNSVLHAGVPVEIGDNVIIGHGAIVHGMKVGSNTLIGNNATILNYVEIGDDCVIAAGSLLPEKMKITDRSLVAGVPAKIKGETPSRLLEWVKNGCREYVELARKYKQQGL